MNYNFLSDQLCYIARPLHLIQMGSAKIPVLIHTFVWISLSQTDTHKHAHMYWCKKYHASRQFHDVQVPHRKNLQKSWKHIKRHIPIRLYEKLCKTGYNW